MTIKDFVPGQTAYMVGDAYHRGDKTISEVTVVNVGRKYVTVNKTGGWPIRFCNPGYTTEFFIEDANYRATRTLFPTRESIEECYELNELRQYISNAMDSFRMKKYTLDQLREVKKILEGDKDS